MEEIRYKLGEKKGDKYGNRWETKRLMFKYICREKNSKREIDR